MHACKGMGLILVRCRVDYFNEESKQRNERECFAMTSWTSKVLLQQTDRKRGDRKEAVVRRPSNQIALFQPINKHYFSQSINPISTNQLFPFQPIN